MNRSRYEKRVSFGPLLKPVSPGAPQLVECCEEFASYRVSSYYRSRFLGETKAIAGIILGKNRKKQKQKNDRWQQVKTNPTLA